MNMIFVNDYYEVGNEISDGSDKRQRISPLTPIVKIANFDNVIDMTLPKWAIFTMGVYGESLCLLSDHAGISFPTI